jgi:hypothetical protein
MNKRDQVILDFTPKPYNLFSDKEMQHIVLKELIDLQPIRPIIFIAYIHSTFNVDECDIRKSISKLIQKENICYDDCSLILL